MSRTLKQHCPQAEVVYDLFHSGGLLAAERWWTGCEWSRRMH